MVDDDDQIDGKKDDAITRLDNLDKEQLENLIDYLHNEIHIE